VSSSKSFLNKNGIKILFGIIAVSIIVFAYSKLSPKQFACVYETDKLSYSTLKIDRFWKRMTFYPVEPSPGRHDGIKMGPYPYQRTKRGAHYATRSFWQRKLTDEEKQLKKRSYESYYWTFKGADETKLEMWLSRKGNFYRGYELQIITAPPRGTRLQEDEKLFERYTCYLPKVKKKKYFKKRKKYDL
tara:strand:- start:29 stop:592 length:564 start_codon:yes stop_codon:yes gene_type:complete